MNHIYRSFIVAFVLFSNIGCEKLVEIDPPVDSIIFDQTYTDNNNANALVTGIYSELFKKQSVGSFGNGGISVYCGLSADELAITTPSENYLELYRNTLRPQSTFPASIWNQIYRIIYQTNSVVIGLSKSRNVTESAKQQYLSEAKVLRAFCYYYLISLWGDVPYVTDVDWETNTVVQRMAMKEIRNLIINDLKLAAESAPETYAPYKEERVRVTKWAALALLSRYYLLDNNWDAAETAATLVINQSSLFSLLKDPNAIFLKNSKEALLQWHNTSQLYPYNVLPENLFIIPITNSNAPTFYLSDELVGSYDTTDLRRTAWIGKSTFRGKTYNFLSKYKVSQSQGGINLPVTEYYTVLRLAEIILNRAEANLNLGNLDKAIADINAIRARANLKPVAPSTIQDAKMFLLSERRKELSCEWGSRWIDLRRTNSLDSVMTRVSALKGSKWEPFRQWFPISQFEIESNPAMTQNIGY